jgi:hypothetical protein
VDSLQDFGGFATIVFIMENVNVDQQETRRGKTNQMDTRIKMVLNVECKVYIALRWLLYTFMIEAANSNGSGLNAQEL